MVNASDLLYSWSQPCAGRLSRVRLEEDIRDALQNLRTTAPSLIQRRHLLELSNRVGVRDAFLGFPAASDQEAALCLDLAAHAGRQGLAIKPVFMARAVPADVGVILDIQATAGHAVMADIFIGISALRLAVEGWTLSGALEKLTAAASLAKSQGLKFRISLEDSSRTPPEHLARAVLVAVDLGAAAIVLCDTSGDCLPDGAGRHTSFVVETLAAAGRRVEVGWHGHNDKGLSLANALAAVEAGADLISGTFLGIGERTGNTPLEQLIVLLAAGGNSWHDPGLLVELCETFAQCVGIPVPAAAPLVGADAFCTSTGTHAAALLKARQFGPEYEDLMYSGVPARSLGRRQQMMIGPNSGRRAVQAVLLEHGLADSEENIDALLRHCKQAATCLYGGDALLRVLSNLDPQKA